ncbi:MAG: hypothetical protein V4603_02560 [Pseudomonadota bacterium]
MLSRTLKTLATLTLCALPLLSAHAQPPAADAAPPLPTPRHADGRINFGPPEGEVGFWVRRTANLVINPDSYEAERSQRAPIHIKDVPIQDWALAITNYRQQIFLASEPYTRCKPAGGPRQIMSPYGFEILDMPELERLYIVTTSNAMTYRIVYMDGREHPKDLQPSYFGHSVGHWEGDTLVIDSVGYNEKSWQNRDGLPSTSLLHLTERFTRVNMDTLEYKVTIDDPGAYTAPWETGYTIGWTADEELFEYVCQENNLSPESMIGAGRISTIVP